MKNLKTFLIVGLIAALEVGITMGVAELGVEVYEEYENKTLIKKWQDLKEKADKGDAEAQYIVGQIYLDNRVYFPDEYNCFVDIIGLPGGEVIRDESKGAFWLLQAAKQGHGDAQAELAQCYIIGEGVMQDLEKCIMWLKEGCRSGSPLAQWRLGNLYRDGLAYKYNISNGEYYWKQGIFKGWDRRYKLDEGDPIYFEKGSNRTYLSRTGLRDAIWGSEQVILEMDITKAKYYWKLAAEQGFEEAIESLQKIYEDD